MSFTATVPATLEDALGDIETRFLYNLPESELNSPERLFYQIEQAYWYYEDFKADRYSHLPHFSTLKSFATKIFQHCELLQNMSTSFHQLFSEYKEYKAKIPVCGCILMNPDMTKIVLVKDWNGGSWTFPRGKVNEGEDEFECAVREVYEETGFNARDHSDPQNFVVTFHGEKKIQLFIAVNVPDSTVFATHCRKEVSDIQFHALNKIPSHTYNVHPFIPKLKRWIVQRQKENKAAANRTAKSPKLPAQPTPSTKGKKKKGNGIEEQPVAVPRILKRLKNEFDARNTDTFEQKTKKGWSVADMFRANAQITGRDYTYNGNPHDFGDAHPRFVKYTGSSSGTTNQQNVELDYLLFAQQSQTFTVQPEVGTTTVANGAIMDFYALQNSLRAERRRYWKKFTLDVSSIMKDVDQELKARPIL